MADPDTFLEDWIQPSSALKGHAKVEDWEYESPTAKRSIQEVDERVEDQLDRLNTSVLKALEDALHPQHCASHIDSQDSLSVSSNVSKSLSPDYPLLLDRTLMQFEDVLSHDQRNQDLLWESEDGICIEKKSDFDPFPGDEIPSSPASPPPKLIRTLYSLGGAMKSGVDFLDGERWNCSHAELVDLFLHLRDLLETARSGRAVESELRIGEREVGVSVEGHCPETPQFAGKARVAGEVSKGVAWVEGWEKNRTNRQQAYITQLENELSERLCAYPDQSSSLLSSPCLQSDHLIWERQIEALVYQLTAGKSVPKVDTHLQRQVSLALKDLKRVKTVAQTQYKELVQAVRDLRSSEQEYLNGVESYQTQAKELSTGLRTAQGERDFYKEELETYRARLQGVLGKVSTVADALAPLLRIQLMSHPDPEKEPKSQPGVALQEISAQIHVLEEDIGKAEPWQSQKLKVRLTLLRNKQLRMRSESAILGSQQQSNALILKTEAIHNIVNSHAAETKQKRRILSNVISTCNSPGKNHSAILTDRRRHDSAGCFDEEKSDDFCQLERSGFTNSDAVSGCRHLIETLSSKVQELEGRLKTSNRKEQELSEIEAELRAGQRRQSLLSDVFTKRETELKSKENEVMKIELSLLESESNSGIVSELQRKYTKQIKLTSEKERRAGEDLVRLKGLEEELRRREKRIRSDQEEVMKQRKEAEDRLTAVGRVQSAVVSLYSELQGLAL